MWFDSHCHLDFPAFDPDRAAVIERASALSVTELFIPGVEPSQWSGLPALQRQYGFPFGVGHHPDYLARQAPAALAASLAGLSDFARWLGAAAIGETGLDQRVASAGGASLALQKESLVAHVICARELRLPLVLHVVQAHGAALELLQRYGPFPVGGVLHGYSGSAELVTRYARLNLQFSFGGAVTRPSAKKMQRAVQAVADDQLLLETDAPDQTPTGFSTSPLDPGASHLVSHGEADGATNPEPATRPRNEPAALLVVAARVAELRGVGVEHVLSVASANARRLFSGP